MGLREELDQINKINGRLTRQQVVEEARDASAYPSLHGHLWTKSDEELAAEHRLHVAGELIRSYRIKYRPVDAPEREVRAYVATRTPTYGYERVEDVVRNPVARKVLLAEMEREWRAFKARWEYMQEFADLIGEDLALAGRAAQG